jgi:hypothetical protein
MFFPDPTSPSHHPDKKEGGGDFVDIAIPSFASGALLAIHVFIVIPEGLYLIQSFITESAEEDGHRRFLEVEEVEVHDEHAGELSLDVIWRFVASLLGGFIVSLSLPPQRMSGGSQIYTS